MEDQARQDQDMIYCDECRTGIMKQEKVTYYAWTMHDLITVPDFPAWVCDVCGHREFDMNALHNLNTMLRSDVPGHKKTAKPKPSITDQTTLTTHQPD